MIFHIIDQKKVSRVPLCIERCPLRMEGYFKLRLHVPTNNLLQFFFGGGGAKDLNKFKIDDSDKHFANVEDAFVDEEVVEERRGFVPSDVKDPGKREFLTQLRN